MKRFFKLSGLLGLLLLTLICIMPGCRDRENDVSVNGERYSLAEFEGWWYRPDNYVSEGVSIVDIFQVDAAAGKWTVYNNYGMAGKSFDCYGDENGLTLEMDALGDAAFSYNGEALLNEDGGVEFVRGKPMESFDRTLFEGKWYKSGDTKSDYYLIEGDTYKKLTYYSKDKPEETGTWKINDVKITLGNDSSIKETQIEFETPDDVFGGGDYVPSEDNTVLFNDFDNVFYVKESAIGTSAGDNAIAKFNLICHDWKGAEFGDPYLSFSYYGTFEITIFNDEGKGKRETAGNWSIDGKMLTLVFNDSTTETVPYLEESITVKYYDMTFKKDSW